MRQGYTHISLILDRSGSMYKLRNDAINGFNSFINDQKKLAGKVTITLVQFNETYEVIQEFADLQLIPDLSEITYKPMGNTALRDAIGTTINNTGRNLENMKEEDRPEKVVVVIITDGEENASKNFEACLIKEMIERQQNVYNWQFVFIGSNQDAILAAADYGIAAAQALTYSSNEQGIKMSYDILSANIGKVRLGIDKELRFNDLDRQIANKLK